METVGTPAAGVAKTVMEYLAAQLDGTVSFAKLPMSAFLELSEEDKAEVQQFATTAIGKEAEYFFDGRSESRVFLGSLPAIEAAWLCEVRDIPGSPYQVLAPIDLDQLCNWQAAPADLPDFAEVMLESRRKRRRGGSQDQEDPKRGPNAWIMYRTYWSKAIDQCCAKMPLGDRSTKISEWWEKLGRNGGQQAWLAESKKNVPNEERPANEVPPANEAPPAKRRRARKTSQADSQPSDDHTAPRLTLASTTNPLLPTSPSNDSQQAADGVNSAPTFSPQGVPPALPSINPPVFQFRGQDAYGGYGSAAPEFQFEGVSFPDHLDLPEMPTNWDFSNEIDRDWMPDELREVHPDGMENEAPTPHVQDGGVGEEHQAGNSSVYPDAGLEP